MLASLLTVEFLVFQLLSDDIRERRGLHIPCPSPWTNQIARRRADHLKPTWIQDWADGAHQLQSVSPVWVFECPSVSRNKKEKNWREKSEGRKSDWVQIVSFCICSWRLSVSKWLSFCLFWTFIVTFVSFCLFLMIVWSVSTRSILPEAKVIVCLLYSAFMCNTRFNSRF